MSAPDITTVKSKARGKPSLSVLVPYYRDNPAPLLRALITQAALIGGIDIALYDDGTNDKDLNKTLAAIIREADCSVTLYSASENKGRSTARNYLQAAARAEWVLFLDADMRPDKDTFLSDYLRHIKRDDADILFGGFTVPAKSEDAQTELHRALSQASDCLPLNVRRAAGAQYVATSNLCVRTSVLKAEGFDDGFIGWGWEDSEWAARVANRFRLKHIENSALHLGLETDATLLRRFKDSARNYVRFTQKHPELAQSLTLFKLSHKLRKLPGQKLFRPLYKKVVEIRFLPIRLRVLALKLWRASWYAEAF